MSERGVEGLISEREVDQSLITLIESGPMAVKEDVSIIYGAETPPYI